MKYIVIMWILCLFVTGRHFYIHRPKPQIIESPKIEWQVGSVTEGVPGAYNWTSGVGGSSIAVSGTARGGSGGAVLIIGGSGGVASAASTATSLRIYQPDGVHGIRIYDEAQLNKVVQRNTKNMSRQMRKARNGR